MDQTARLIGEVAARYGIRLDPDDPAFALVALNQLVLHDTIDQLQARMDEVAAKLEHSAEGVGLRAGIAVAEQIRRAWGTSYVAPGPTLPHAGGNGRADTGLPKAAFAMWIAIGALGGLLLFGLGLLVGARVL